jgi:lipoprotein-anchoring transpeptidase ErfK/SrfK
MRNRTFILVAGLLVVLLIGAGAVYAYDAAQEGQIADGIEVGGVPIGGLSRSAARAKLQRDLVGNLNRPVSLRGPGGRAWTITARQAHVALDLDGMVQKAIDRSRRGSIVSRSFREITGGSVRVDLPPEVTFWQPAVNRTVRRVRTALNRPPVDATVEPGSDGLRKVPGRSGLTVQTNELRHTLERTLTRPSSDRTVVVPVRKLRPKVTTKSLVKRYPNYIVVNRGGFQLRYYHDLKLVKTYPIAVGQQGLETPAGLYDIQDKQVNPSWHVPNSDWAGDLAGQVIPPGPQDPIKARWMGIDGGAGIHGTVETGSLGSAASHGCIRMAIPDVIDLYDRVEVGTPVYII